MTSIKIENIEDAAVVLNSKTEEMIVAELLLNLSATSSSEVVRTNESMCPIPRNRDMDRHLIQYEAEVKRKLSQVEVPEQHQSTRFPSGMNVSTLNNKIYHAAKTHLSQP